MQEMLLVVITLLAISPEVYLLVLAISSMIKHNVKPMEFGHSTFGGWSRNLFKDMSKEFFKIVVADTTSRSAIVYSAFISSAISGWY